MARQQLQPSYPFREKRIGDSAFAFDMANEFLLLQLFHCPFHGVGVNGACRLEKAGRIKRHAPVTGYCLEDTGLKRPKRPQGKGVVLLFAGKYSRERGAKKAGRYGLPRGRFSQNGDTPNCDTPNCGENITTYESKTQAVISP